MTSIGRIYAIYRLPLPSGGVVRARKAPGIFALALSGGVQMPLLSAAISAAVKNDQEARRPEQNPVARLHALIRWCLRDPDLTPEDLPWVDRMAICSWATAPGTDGAEVEGEREWTSADVLPIISSSVAPLLDLVGKRYGQRPSRMIGADDATWSAEFDVAVAYRGSRIENTSVDDTEVDVEDVWGNVHRVPQSWLAQTPNGARVMDVSYYARQLTPGNQVTLSAGGGEAGDGLIGLQQRFRN